MIPDRELPNFSGLKLLSAQILISLFGFGSMLRQRTDLEPATYAVRSIGRYQEYQEEVGPRSEVKKNRDHKLTESSSHELRKLATHFLEARATKGPLFFCYFIALVIWDRGLWSRKLAGRFQTKQPFAETIHNPSL
jgi:hypothetical protein